MADVTDKLLVSMNVGGTVYDFYQPVDSLTFECIKSLEDQNLQLVEKLLEVNDKANDLTLRLNDVMRFVLTDTVELTIFASLAAGFAKYATNMSSYKRGLYAELAEVCRDIVDENVKVA